MASTVQEALLVLQTVLDTLLLRCTPPTITRTQGVTSTRYRDGIVLTSATLRNAFQIISRESTQQILSQFFSRLFGQVYELLTNAYEIELASQLELVSDIITAVYQTSATDKYNVEQSWQANTPVLHALIINLLEPTWSLLDRLRVRGDAKHAGDQIPSFYPLLRAEEIMATILITFCRITELQGHRRPHMLHVVSLVASLYDECFLPIHLSSRCTQDPLHLFSGVLTLFQLFRELHSFESIQRAYKKLVARLCASDTIGRALHVMQTASVVMHVASCKALIVTMLVSTGVFCNPAQDVAFIRPGDLPPRLEALATLNYSDLPSHMVPGDGLNSNLLHLHHENQRWAIAFLYMQLTFARYPAMARGLTESISNMIIKETTLDHLYGASWIQLTWIYIKLDCGDDKSRFQAKPFTYSKLTNGLRISIRDSVGGFARRLLTRHLEEILIWLWRHEWLHSDETLRVSNDLILEMMMIWIMDYFPSVLSHRPVLKDGAKVERISKTILMFPCAIESIKTLFEDAFRVLVYEDEQSLLEERLRILCILCSIVRACVEWVNWEYNEARYSRFLISVAGSTLRFLSNSVRSSRGYLWELFDSIAPLFRILDCQIPQLQWDHAAPDASSVISQALLQIEIIHTDDQLKSRLPILEKLTTTVRLLTIYAEFDKSDIFEDEPILLPALWSVIQDLMNGVLEAAPEPHPDEQWADSDLQQITARCLLQGMLLLNVVQNRLPFLFTVSTDNLILMVHYCLELFDVVGKDRSGCMIEKSGLSALAIVLLRRLVISLTDSNANGNNEPWLELDMQLDLLLDMHGGVLLNMTDSMAIWRALHDWVGVLQSLSESSPLQSSPPPSQPTTYNHDGLFAENWLKSKIHHPRHAVVTKTLLNRWLSKARQAKQSGSSQLVADRSEGRVIAKRSERSLAENDSIIIQDTAHMLAAMSLSERTLRQAAQDILAIIKIISESSDHNEIVVEKWIANRADQGLFQEYL